MAKSKRNEGRTETRRAARGEMEEAYRLWSLGNVAAARRKARELLADPEFRDRPAAERILADTGTDRFSVQIAVGTLLLVAVVLILLKFAT